MKEQCKHCKHCIRLKHNFTVGKGFEESFCCIVLVHDEDGFVIEVSEDSMCEIFKAKEN